MSAYQTYLPDCDCKNGGILFKDNVPCCRWCRKPWGHGGMINYLDEHFPKPEPEPLPSQPKEFVWTDALVKEFCYVTGLSFNNKYDIRQWVSDCMNNFKSSHPSTAAERPKIVCLCGSTRFMDAFQAANLKLTCEGVIVLSVGCNTKSDRDLLFSGELTEELKIKLDELHKRKIGLADEIFVLNVGGYIGESTRSEIEYAEKMGKPVKYLESKPSQKDLHWV